MPGKKKAIVTQERGKTRQDFVLRWLVKIDHDIATKKGIEGAANSPVRLEKIQTLKADHPPQLRLHDISPLLRAGSFKKEATQPFSGNLINTVQRINSLCGGGQHVSIQIGCYDTYLRRSEE